jgi:hypothetical protein
MPGDTPRLKIIVRRWRLYPYYLATILRTLRRSRRAMSPPRNGPLAVYTLQAESERRPSRGSLRSRLQAHSFDEKVLLRRGNDFEAGNAAAPKGCGRFDMPWLTASVR